MSLQLLRTIVLVAVMGTCLNCRPTSTTAPADTAGPASSEAAKAAPPVAWEEVAQRIVNQSAGVKEGDVVQIAGGVQDIELLEDIAVQVRKVGAFPLVRLNSDRMDRRMITDVPEKYDSQPFAWDMNLARVATVNITITSRTTEDLLANIDPKRLALRGQADSVVANELLKRKVRQVTLDNTLYPTSWRAKQLGMTEAELAKTFWEGVNLDYSALQAKGEQVSKVLAAGNELHITNPNGTDLKLKVQGRPVSVSDGIISATDIQKGGADLQVWLPAGEVYFVPVAGSCEGKVVQLKNSFEGRELQNLNLTFAKGKVVSMTGTGPGFELLKSRYDAAGEGRDALGVVDFGINPNIKVPKESPGEWVSSGTISVGIGGNVWAGGSIGSSFAYPVFLPGSTVTLDGKAIISAGQLQVSEQP